MLVMRLGWSPKTAFLRAARLTRNDLRTLSEVFSLGCKVSRTCAYCGKAFQTYPSEVKRGGGKYCSVSCSDRGHVKAKECICHQCGKSFTQTPCRLKLGYGKFCSHKCQGESSKTKILIECARCGKHIEKRPCVINAGYGKFCSHECADENRKENAHIGKICKHCGKVFLSLKSNTRRGNDLFCSARCRFAANVGENNPAWKGGITPKNIKIRMSVPYNEWKRAVFARDNWTCQTCGKHGGYLEAHHIEPFSTHPDLRFDISNGQTLCLKCHQKSPDHQKIHHEITVIKSKTKRLPP